MNRLFDLFCSTVGLVFLTPLFCVVAAIIKLSDGGPVFFKQVRVGQNGQHFHILKFRTMSPRAELAGLPITVGPDPRITRVGKWLRQWKIDEFPQLINVLRGEMGLVGPRPEVPRYVAFYTEAQAQVLLLRPGITDAASITYRCENEVLSRSENPETFYLENVMPNKIRINLEYAAKATLWTNFQVILATLGLLPPPVRVRQAGDLRAFDRIPFGGPVQVTTGDLPPSEEHPINISIGGILLRPGSSLAVGNVCDLTISPDSHGLDLLATEGVVIRTNDQGTAVRFSQPMKEGALKAIEAPKGGG